MLNLDDDHAREVWPGPLLVKLVRALLHDFVIALKLEPLAVFRFQIWIGRRLAEAAEVGREVAVKMTSG